MTFSTRGPSRYWADLSTTEFAKRIESGAASEVVAVLPVAATEQHGPHLPLSVDTTLADGVIAACLPHLPAHLSVLFLPTQQVGLSPEHLRFPGTLSLNPETVIRVWTELGACVARAGVKKLVLFNSHGGQVSVMDIVARELRAHHDMMVFSTSWYSLPLGDAADALFSAKEQRFGIHAGDMETSMMLALRPHRVSMSKAQNFPSTSQTRAQLFPILGNGKSAKFGWQMQDYNMEGAVGNAAAATPEKGKVLVEAAAQQLALLLQEIAQLPLSTLVDQPKSD